MAGSGLIKVTITKAAEVSCKSCGSLEDVWELNTGTSFHTVLCTSCIRKVRDELVRRGLCK